MNNYDKINNILLLFLTFLIIVIYINLPSISNLISEIFIYIYLTFGILMLALTIAKKDTKIKFNYFFNFVIIVLLTTIGCIINGTAIGNLIIINCTYIYIYIFKNTNVSKKTKKIFLILFAILGIIQIVNVEKSVDLYYINKDKYLNPNLISQLLLFILIYINTLFKVKKKLEKILLIVINAIIFNAIYLSDSRNILMTGLIYIIILYLIPKKITKKKYIINFSFLITYILSLIIPITIVYLFKNNIYITIPFSSKTIFSGREHIWLVLFNNIKNFKDVLFGIPISNYINFLSTTNLHNIYITVFANYGLITLILYYGHIYKEANSNGINLDPNIKWGIIIILLSGIFENIIMTSTLNFLFCMLFCFNNNENDEVKK